VVGLHLGHGKSGRSRTGNGETQLTVESPTRRGRHGIAVGLLGALAVTAFAASPADARHYYVRHASHSESSGPPYAAIVVDANTGTVLHADNPDEPRHPASLTKIMTLYLLFERLEAGKLRLDTPLSVSAHAADQAPTKLGLRPDQTIVVEDAIRGLVTKSANDAAVVIAEAIGGDEHEFAEMMTRKARALGMSRTVYLNASGLPNDEQITTARDQALLGRVIQERFPRYYTYFSTPSFTYRGVSMRNHNQLLGRVEGVDGIKTGYTQASGYNLVASVRRGNRHLVSVVLGGSSAGARDARMRSLIEEYIVVASTQKSATAVAEAPSARNTRTAEANHAEARQAETRQVETKPVDAKAAETRATDPPTAKGRAAARRATQPNPAAVYAVASYSKPIPWPQTGAPATSALVANPPPAAADTTAAVAPQAPRNPATEPIRPIAVKTVKAKLPPTQVAEMTTPANGPAAAEAPAPVPAPPDLAVAAPPKTIVAPQKPIEAAVVPAPDVAPVETRREPAREVAPPPPSPPVRSAAATTASPPSAPVQHQPPAITHSGWIIQVGAYETEQDARQKLSTVQAKTADTLAHADPFTEPVVKGDRTFYRARFAGLHNKDEAEAICRKLKRNDIDCMTIKN
jgi:D-alanyl-D-alanine carboxypeptidase